MNPIPILVPLYYSSHLIEKFESHISKETKTPFKIYYLDNESGAHNNKKWLDLFERLPKVDRYIRVDEVNNFYSESVNWLFQKAKRDNPEMDKFLVFNPDCFPLEDNWLSRMIEIWDEIKTNDNNIFTLGTLQYNNWEETSVWVFGCFWKPNPEDRCHDLDWFHNPHYNGQRYIRCEGNTGTALMFDANKFEELGMYDSKTYPHYSSDAKICLLGSESGFTHYSCNCKMYHVAGNSSQKEN